MIKEQSEGDESEEADRDKVFRTLLAMASRPDSVPCPQGSVGAQFRAPKGCQFSSWSGHMPGLQVQSLLEAHMRGNLSCFSHIDVSLSPTSLPLSKNQWKHVLG